MQRTPEDAVSLVTPIGEPAHYITFRGSSSNHLNPCGIEVLSLALPSPAIHASRGHRKLLGAFFFFLCRIVSCADNGHLQ